MTDSLSSVLSPSAPAAASVAASASSGAPGGSADPTADAGATARPASFVKTLGQFLDARDTTPDRSIAATGTRDGQDPAADGKDLPAAATDEDGEPVATPPLWFPAFVAPQPVVAPVAAAAQSALLASSPAIAAPGLPATASPPLPLAPGIAEIEQRAATPGTAAAATQLAAARPSLVTPAATAIDPDMVVATRQTTTAAQVQTTSTSTPVTPAPPETAFTVGAAPQPAGQVFAAAIATATSWRDHEDRGATRDALGSATGSGTATPLALQDRAMVHAAGDAQGSALDLTKDSGLQSMIDRIETLRDDANASDTRVRLVPDALGSVDITVRQVGDRVHVHFTAAQDATRALIAEAQPRLTDLAAARGVRIGETSVGGGSSGGQTTSDNRPTSAPRPAPALVGVPPSTLTDSTITTDQRLA